MTVSINGTSGLTFNDASTQNTAATGFGFKNRLINGACMIDQRNAGASVALSSSVLYSVDRFQCRLGTSTSSTAQQSSTAPSGFSKSLLLTIGTGASPSAGAGTGYFSQGIEGFNCADLGWGTASAATVTLSFWVRSSLTGTFGICVGNDSLTRTYPTSYTITAANTWEQKTITIAGSTSGSFPTDNSGCVRVMFDWGSGSDYKGTANTWANADYRGGATGTQSICATSGATWLVTGVQLEKGSTATSFDYRPYGTELALCQRYYEKSYDQATVPGTAYTGATWVGTVNPASTSRILGMAYFKVSKRTVPTIAFWAENGTATNVTMPDVSAAVACTSANRISETGIGEFILSAGNTGSRIAVCHWTATAEL